VNEVVCHGVPSRARVLRDGDIVNVDVTTHVDGFHGDTSETFFVGEPSSEARRLVETARACRDAGIAVARHGARLGDVGAAIEEVARAAGMSVVRDFGGHGIGREMHTAPHVPHFGRRGTGPRLVAGMAITVEPMINLGRPDVILLDGEWNAVTADGSWSAQFEHTILIERDGAEILTRALSSVAR
jgi:methionyl aminopeptidase